MSRYVDIKKLKLTNTDREIFVMRLAEGHPLTKKWIWKCVKREVIERGYQGTSANSLSMYAKFKTCIPTHSMASKKWQKFYDRCCERTELFQIYRMAADMQVHEQLLKTSVEQQFFKYMGWLQIRCKHRHRIVSRHLCSA